LLGLFNDSQLDIMEGKFAEHSVSPSPRCVASPARPSTDPPLNLATASLLSNPTPHNSLSATYTKS
jgi:hypothetical protein